MGFPYSTDSPEAFLRFAHQYQRAATALIPHAKEAEAPLYFTFAHTVEPALKAFIRTRAPSVVMTHSLIDLHRDCRKLGLPEDSRLTNIVKLLQQETNFHGFRYYKHKTLWRPSLDNLCEVVDALIAFVTREVAAHSTPNVGSRDCPEAHGERGTEGAERGSFRLLTREQRVSVLLARSKVALERAPAR